METLVATFVVDLNQPKGTIGPKHSPLYGLKPRGDGIIRDPLNEPIYCAGWDAPTEVKEARMYVFDSETDKEHPLIRAFYVTRGSLRAPLDSTGKNPKKGANNNAVFPDNKGDGWWTGELITRKHKEYQARGKFLGKNEYNSDGVVGMLRGVTVGAPMLLASIEEKRKDKCVGGIKYLVLEGGESFLRKRSCNIM